MALISVIMPAFNAGTYISEAINSVLKQNHSNWELLIVNDGSTDNTESIIKSIADPRIKYFKKENGGVSSARNLALQNMKGEYFCFLDADDTFPKDALETRLKPFEKDKNLFFVDGIVNIQNSDLSKTIRTYSPISVENPTEEFCRLNPKVFFGPTWTFKRIPERNYRLHEDLTHGEDFFFYLENLSISNKIGLAHKAILNYRTGNNSAMSNLNGLEKGYRTIAEKMKGLPHVSEANRQVFKSKTKSIMFKSYLGVKQPFNALKVLLT